MPSSNFSIRFFSHNLFISALIAARDIPSIFISERKASSHQFPFQIHHFLIIYGCAERVIIKLLTLQDSRSDIIALIHILDTIFFICATHPQIILSIKQIQQLAIVCRENKRCILSIYFFILVQTNDILY